MNKIKKPTKEELKRKIVFEPGFDFIAQPTKEHRANYERRGLNIRFLVEGKKGVIAFVLSTGWLPMVKENYCWEPTYKRPSDPYGAQLGYHAYKPTYKGEESKNEKCEFLHNKRCYFSASFLQAEEYFAELCNEGEDALFKKMEGHYKDVFN